MQFDDVIDVGATYSSSTQLDSRPVALWNGIREKPIEGGSNGWGTI